MATVCKAFREYIYLCLEKHTRPLRISSFKVVLGKSCPAFTYLNSTQSLQSLALFHGLFEPPALIGLFALQTYTHTQRKNYSTLAFSNIEKITITDIHHEHTSL